MDDYSDMRDIEIAKLERDAERYRWLRDQGSSVKYTHRPNEEGLHCEIHGADGCTRRETLDAAIDAAMSSGV